MKCAGMVVLVLLMCIPVIYAEMPSLPPGIAAPAEEYPAEGFAPGVVLVRASIGETEAAETVLATAHASIGASILTDYSALGCSGLQLVSLPEKMSVSDAVLYYSAIPGIRYAEPDYLRSLDTIPDDPELWREWGLSNTGQVYKEDTSPGKAGADIHAPWAWNVSTGGSTIIAVLDSGVDYLHPDLADNIWINPVSGTHGYDAITGGLDPMDLASHGTHCAGIIGAVGNNSLGISGVNWNASILPVRFLNSFGTGTVSDEIGGILWAARNGATVFSCSYGGSGYSQAEYEVISGTDGLFVCAAGNSGLDNDAVAHYPCSYDLANIIAVAATNAHDELASFSNYGAKSVDLGAPGEDIYSTKHNLYKPEPVWQDTFDSFGNWTTHGNWTLSTVFYASPPSSGLGTVNNTGTNQTDPPAILSLKQPLTISTLTNPIISYELQIVGVNCTFAIEGSNNNLTWTTLEYYRSAFALMPFSHHECKIPVDLAEGPLYIRFKADGKFIGCFIDDVTLSDGYGDLTEIRYGYMSGTSMAAPHVSGMVGLLTSIAPDASPSDIRDAILKTVDPLTGLQHKTTTGGRANLSAALVYLEKPVPERISLFPGWNHVSVAKRLKAGNDTASEVFGTVTNTSGHSVLRYNSTEWLSVSPDEVITPLLSYWIWTGDAQNITPDPDPDQTGTYTRDLIKGWNGFGVPGTDVLPAKNRLLQLGDNWTYIIGYNAPSQYYEEPIIRDGTGNQSDTRNLLPWQGYWLYVTDSVPYTVTL